MVLIDCYSDEPSSLGVRPYICPDVRKIFGILKFSKYPAIYLTIDHLRESKFLKKIENAKVIFVYGGTAVPGRYIRSMPASDKELKKIGEIYENSVLVGPIADYGDKKIHEVFGDVVMGGVEKIFENYGKYLGVHCDDREKWLLKGAKCILHHPDYPRILICEIELSRGCPRYITGGCSFCIEPLSKEFTQRDVEDVINEIKVLFSLRAKNFRLGGTSCIFSYHSRGIGEKERPEPNPEAIEKLLKGINSIGKMNVLHTDNANPGIIAEHPKKSEKIVKLLVEYCTSGNVLSLGLESADEKVRKMNRLNASSEEAMKSIEIINKYGRYSRGYDLPSLLPGLNFIMGLKGESRETWRINREFLENVESNGYLLRRINIRELQEIRCKAYRKYIKEAKKFKWWVRNHYDKKMLKKVCPRGTVLRNLYVEYYHGKYTYSRQVGTYPLLTVIPYRVKKGDFFDVKIVAHGGRSVTGIEYPLNLNKASLNALKSIPGIGSKRASEIIRNRPYDSITDLRSKLNEELYNILKEYGDVKK